MDGEGQVGNGPHPGTVGLIPSACLSAPIEGRQHTLGPCSIIAMGNRGFSMQGGS